MYRLSDPVEGCTHCVSRQEEAQLRDTPLRHLTREDARLVLANILLTWGSQDDFRYFLPRLTELAVTGEFYDQATALLDRVRFAGFDAWPEEEREAVRAFARAWWASPSISRLPSIISSRRAP